MLTPIRIDDLLDCDCEAKREAIAQGDDELSEDVEELPSAQTRPDSDYGDSENDMPKFVAASQYSGKPVSELVAIIELVTYASLHSSQSKGRVMKVCFGEAVRRRPLLIPFSYRPLPISKPSSLRCTNGHISTLQRIMPPMRFMMRFWPRF